MTENSSATNVLTDEQSLMLQSTYDPNGISGNKKLRISKSSFMQARQCRRKYWWNKVMFPDVRLPPTEAMLRGNVVHEVLENVYEKYDGEDDVASLFPIEMKLFEGDETVFTLANLEQQRLDSWGAKYFKPISFEEKMAVYDEIYDVVMVGAWDGLLLHPSGGLCLVELKTGDLSTGKLSRVRKELCFYARMINLLGIYEQEITHFMICSSNCTNDRTARSLLKSKSKEVFLGDNGQGLTVIEKINKRSITSFEKEYAEVIANLKAKDWSPDWNDYFCGEFCDYMVSCDDELHGSGASPFDE